MLLRSDRRVEAEFETASQPLRNRVDPFGDLQAASLRGLFTGNRGCLVDDRGEVVRHHRGDLWIICRLEYRGWKHPLNQPGTWTPLFFLDDAVALAAGHRPCGLCRREAYQAYQAAVGNLSATAMNRRLAAERQRLWVTDVSALPSGTVILVDEGRPGLVLAGQVLDFTFEGWTSPAKLPRTKVRVLTPPTSVAALANGFVPVLHPSAV